MNLLCVVLGAVVGAPLRHLVDRDVQRRHRSGFPLGTLVVNLVASFVLGVVVGGLGGHPRLQLLLGTGFCGALSTWSTFSFETVRLAEDRRAALAATNAAVSLVAGVLAAALGLVAARQLTR